MSTFYVANQNGEWWRIDNETGAGAQLFVISEADLLTLCEEHKQELERLKANPPAWAIKARRGERA